MPLYEYTCTTCSLKTEKLRSVAERDLPQTCPECENPMTRVPSKTGAPQFKGSGWTPTYSLSDVASASAEDLENMR